MGKLYVYLHHQGFDIFLSDKKLSKKECYCAYCDDYDELIRVYEGKETLTKDDFLEYGLIKET